VKIKIPKKIIGIRINMGTNIQKIIVKLLESPIKMKRMAKINKKNPMNMDTKIKGKIKFVRLFDDSCSSSAS
jgi:septation ring formation regulator EzrA